MTTAILKLYERYAVEALTAAVFIRLIVAIYNVIATLARRNTLSIVTSKFFSRTVYTNTILFCEQRPNQSRHVAFLKHVIQNVSKWMEKCDTKRLGIIHLFTNRQYIC